jgi:enoyl-CoA hydratase
VPRTEREVLVDRIGSVAVVTLNAPSRRNVLSAAMVDELRGAYDEIEDARDLNCVVITGAGSAFCAGAELSTLEGGSSGDVDKVRDVYGGFLRVLNSPLPTIGAINGPAVGAGYNLALACEVRLASTRARFDSRFAALSIIPGGGHTWLLTRAVGAQQSTLASLFGEAWDAQAALDRGLVSTVCEPADLMPTALELASRLNEQSLDYVTTFLRLLRSARSGASHADLLAAEGDAQEWSLRQPAFLDALSALRSQIAARHTSP